MSCKDQHASFTLCQFAECASLAFAIEDLDAESFLELRGCGQGVGICRVGGRHW